MSDQRIHACRPTHGGPAGHRPNPIFERDRLDGDPGWDAAWEEAIEPYFDDHDEIGTGPDARGPALLIIEEHADHWSVRQILDDPAGDHDWGISARIDLADSDAAGAAVLRVTDVGQL